MRRLPSVLALLAVLALVTAAAAQPASSPRKLFYEETIPNASSGTVSLTVRGPAAFRIVLRTASTGRTRLFLTGTTAPTGGALLDTKTGCTRKGGSAFCQGAFEALPRGTYTFRVRRDGAPSHVQLTIRW